MDEEKHKFISIQKAAVVILIGLTIGVFFNSTMLYKWANQLRIGWARNFFVYVMEPFHSFCSQATITYPAGQLKLVFQWLTGIEREAGFAAAEDESSSAPPLVAATTAPTAGPIAIAPAQVFVCPTPVSTPFSPNPVQTVAFALPLDYVNSTPEPNINYSAQSPLKILILGDSMVADSLGPMLRRAIETTPEIVSAAKSKYSSGLSRPDFYNWPAQIKEIFSTETFDLIIVMVGMNDAQDFRIDKVSYHYGTDDWFAIYRSRVQDFISLLLTGARRVYWLGMPPMRMSDYSGRMEQLSAIYSASCAAVKHASYIPTAELVTVENNEYVTHLEINHQLVKVRSGDGKHFTLDGAGLVIARVMEKIREDFLFVKVSETASPAP